MNKINPFTKFDKQWALVSAGDEKKSNTMTISWGGLGTLWNKSVAFVFIRDSRYTKHFVDNGETFSVAFFDDSFRKALQLCGSVSGKDTDKWALAGLTPVFKDGTVYPKEAESVLICRKLASVPITKDTFNDSAIESEIYKGTDYHTMYIGEVISECCI